jgi:hypothetical protein
MIEIKTKSRRSPLCGETAKNIPGYVNGTLPIAESLRVDDHLVHCADCRIHYEKEKVSFTNRKNSELKAKNVSNYAIIDNLMNSPDENIRLKNEIDSGTSLPKRFIRSIARVLSIG